MPAGTFIPKYISTQWEALVRGWLLNGKGEASFAIMSSYANTRVGFISDHKRKNGRVTGITYESLKICLCLFDVG